MENLALGYSSKMVVLGGSSLNSPRNVSNQSLFGLTRKPNCITTRTRFSRPLRKALSNSSVVCEYQSSASTKISKLQAQEKRRNECFASIFSSSGKETSSIAVNPQPPMPPPPSQVGSPLFWIGSWCWVLSTIFLGGRKNEEICDATSFQDYDGTYGCTK
ncbi:hypothetical protein POM88_053199 [Heracleum sosnowskyi]|uniref:Uncharacterized protein n=1 Tax=Heracleum sosnowskyi TaxID=360622 RepID=A0AAD8GNR9_9APIA|nr:hypothetical protein POM88_054439 [Heracleum sosnowskyi]KAK1351356.1 hypothetical protein POM88_054442 [Heracleum sosnowskyi]KAK1351359.1 hypothetical protein POM88_054445 [Heracleum sosnowskyi]KAK1352768.1 hypothetical protein POM88_053199 [Heracleum sosnowskyi]